MSSHKNACDLIATLCFAIFLGVIIYLIYKTYDVCKCECRRHMMESFNTMNDGLNIVVDGTLLIYECNTNDKIKDDCSIRVLCGGLKGNREYKLLFKDPDVAKKYKDATVRVSGLMDPWTSNIKVETLQVYDKSTHQMNEIKL